MATIEFEEGAIQIDATIIGEGLGIHPSQVQTQMRQSKITSLCERGVGEDSGRYRLTFFSENRRFRLLVDQEGNVVQRSTIDFGDRSLPAPMRKPSG